MNPALRPTSSLRAVTGGGHSLHGVVDGSIGVDRRPNQPKHNYAPLGHVSISEAGHNPVSGDVLGEAINENLRCGINIDKLFARHRNPLCTKGNHLRSSIGVVTTIRRGIASCRNAQVISSFDEMIDRDQIGRTSDTTAERV